MEHPLEILPQPDDLTCGPTCLHAVYGHYGDVGPLQRVIAEVRPLGEGGTLGVFLGLHALARGYRAVLHTLNLEVFDPTWFPGDSRTLAARLEARLAARGRAGRMGVAIGAFLEFLEAGGQVRWAGSLAEVIRTDLARGRPLLTGLSATFLYGSARERMEGDRLVEDDVAGDPTGHFVVVHGYRADSDTVLVADPLQENPMGGHSYRVGFRRLLDAILLGVMTWDGNVLVIEPREGTR